MNSYLSDSFGNSYCNQKGKACSCSQGSHYCQNRRAQNTSTKNQFSSKSIKIPTTL